MGSGECSVKREKEKQEASESPIGADRTQPDESVVREQEKDGAKGTPLGGLSATQGELLLHAPVPRCRADSQYTSLAVRAGEHVSGTFGKAGAERARPAERGGGLRVRSSLRHTHRGARRQDSSNSRNNGERERSEKPRQEDETCTIEGQKTDQARGCVAVVPAGAI